MHRHSEHWRACAWLLFATAFWGLSFPLARGMWLIQSTAAPEITSFWFAAAGVTIRFAAAAFIVGLVSIRTLRRTTASELWQGAGLAFFGGLGIFFQMDGLAHIPASTSAFLTQFYCLLIPIWAAWRQRMAPRFAVILSSIMVLTGVAVLSNFDWTTLKTGRGEAETLLGAIFFAGQILWLERPKFARNRVSHFSAVMFAGMALLMAPVAILAAPPAGAAVRAYSSGAVWAMLGALVVFCTLGSYMLMNRWQRFVTATEAGLIYCVEPVAAALFALFLPGWISAAANVDYPNEHVTVRLVVGGALITLANVLIQFEALQQRRRGG